MYSRRDILRTLCIAEGTAMTDLSALARMVNGAPSTPRMPLVFVGHGNPMHAITNNVFATEWAAVARELPVPKAIVVVSAHWQTRGTKVTAMERPRTIHDFAGFPDELFAVQYPAPGSPAWAREIAAATKKTIELDHEWGLDHGTWSVLRRMYPNATIPVMQVSLDVNMSPLQHAALAQDVSILRDRGVLLIGSGNIVHNLRTMSMNGAPYAWAQEFDALSADLITKRDVKRLAQYRDLGKAAQLSIPTDEHYLPMLWMLGASDHRDEIRFFNTAIDLGSVSMRSFIAATP